MRYLHSAYNGVERLRFQITPSNVVRVARQQTRPTITSFDAPLIQFLPPAFYLSSPRCSPEMSIRFNISYLLSAGIHHTVTSDTPFVPAIDQYPSHFHSIITSALSSQQEISWNSAIKGYFTQDWADMAQLDMSTNIRDARKGEQRMKQLISALSNHVRRLWLGRNGCLHDSTNTEAQSPSAQAIEIQYYHS